MRRLAAFTANCSRCNSRPQMPAKVAKPFIYSGERTNFLQNETGQRAVCSGRASPPISIACCQSTHREAGDHITSSENSPHNDIPVTPLCLWCMWYRWLIKSNVHLPTRPHIHNVSSYMPSIQHMAFRVISLNNPPI